MSPKGTIAGIYFREIFLNRVQGLRFRACRASVSYIYIYIYCYITIFHHVGSGSVSGRLVRNTLLGTIREYYFLAILTQCLADRHCARHPD